LLHRNMHVTSFTHATSSRIAVIGSAMC